ncbi:uncharacterized protein LOC121731891 [Aricia agestis]|uniref:uncharacterized protein LOC121731891 n=1 Tax=Aricia agestis TaxID=91739 RepID=UPI001C2056EF|nr:uncharacterized protein LOC121731891 [Aricia agestis]
MEDIHNKVFLITGAASGIGAGVVRAVLEKGAKHVAILDIGVEQGKALEAELNAKYGPKKAKFIKCDVTTSDLEAAYEETIEEQGYIDVVVNNAGIMNDEHSVYKKQIAINVTALITSSVIANDLMRRTNGGRGGTIINIASIVGLMQTPFLPIYSATKSAVLHFSNCLGHEVNYARTGVRVIAVCYGQTDTNLLSLNYLDVLDQDLLPGLQEAMKQLPCQSIESAVKGCVEAIERGASGSTWLVDADLPARDISSVLADTCRMRYQDIVMNVMQQQQQKQQQQYLLAASRLVSVRPKHTIITRTPVFAKCSSSWDIMLTHSPMEDIHNKVFLITGAASGIGAGVVRAVLEKGAKHVAILDIGVEQGKALEAELNAKYGPKKAKFIKCDVTTSELEAAYEETIKEQGYIDVVVNNAGIMNDEHSIYKKQIAINVTALITSSVIANDLMRRTNGGRGGTIVNISSIAGLMQIPFFPIYCATKSAVLHFSNCLGHEVNYARTGVRVIAMCYGQTDTNLLSLNSLGVLDQDMLPSVQAAMKQQPCQSIESAVKGCVEAIERGASGSTWLVDADLPARDISSVLADTCRMRYQDIVMSVMQQQKQQ